jgi:hypothetical protein
MVLTPGANVSTFGDKSRGRVGMSAGPFGSHTRPPPLDGLRPATTLKRLAGTFARLNVS